MFERRFCVHVLSGTLARSMVSEQVDTSTVAESNVSCVR
jgi:hypothetical protein